MWFVKQLHTWRDLRKNIKTEIKSAEFMDNVEWQRPLADMDVNMQVVVILYWLSTSKISEKFIKPRLDFVKQRQTVYLCICKNLHKMYVEYVPYVPHSVRDQLTSGQPT